MLNGVATVTTADIIASNGVVHVVDKVIGLPTIVTHALANLTSLVGALTGAGQPDFVTFYQEQDHLLYLLLLTLLYSFKYGVSTWRNSERFCR
jgi:hypothetical protein